MEEYRLIRSKRKSVAIRVEADGSITVRAPLRLSRNSIDSILERHSGWIAEQKERQRRRAELYPEPTEDERREYIRRAKEEIPPLVEKYAVRMGVQPAAITITSARSRFGSCSSVNRLSFSWRLMQYPPETVEAVVVHELCHIVHKNHQKEFYALLRSVLPDYDERTEPLKK